MNQFTDLNRSQRRMLRELLDGPIDTFRFRTGHSIRDLKELEGNGLIETSAIDGERLERTATITDAGRAILDTKPEVGMGATRSGYSDAYAGTIIEVSASGKRLVFQRDKAILLNGANSGEPDALEFSPGGFCGHTSGTQRYAYERDPNGEKITYTLRKNGDFIRQGEPLRASALGIGVRREHYDFNF